MQRQAVLADVDAVDEAGLHHVPADGALQAAQREDAETLQREAAAQLAHEPERDERQREGDADEAAEEAVRPFPPVDGLEGFERHAGVDDAYSGIALYFSNAASQSASLSGGMAPSSGCHSVIDRPLSVRRTAPPTTIMQKTSAATSSSQMRTAPL